MICYLDSSALIKRYVLEAGSDEVERLLSEADAAGTAWISLVEVVTGISFDRQLWLAAQNAGLDIRPQEL